MNFSINLVEEYSKFPIFILSLYYLYIVEGIFLMLYLLLAVNPNFVQMCINTYGNFELYSRISGVSDEDYPPDGERPLVIPQPQENHKGSVTYLLSVAEHPFRRRATHQG